MIASGVKFSCYPTPDQQQILSQWIGCHRFIYNGKAGDQYFRTFRNHNLSLTGIHTPVDQQYSQFEDKSLTPWLYNVPSQILRNGGVGPIKPDTPPPYFLNSGTNFAHKISYSLANSDQQVFIFEDLRITNMTNKPKAKKDENGTS